MIMKTKREETIKNLKSIDLGLRFEYERRLAVPYEKKGQQRSFIDQLLKGGGRELEKKFWSNISSSRLCFELYSCLAEQPECIDVQLEYKLPKIKRLGTPNIDAYVETNYGYYYIESKFTETADNSKFESNLPEQYWKEVDEKGNRQEGGGFHTTNNQYRKTPLIYRYGRDNYELMNKYVSFCNDVNQMKNKQEDWFDAKQETCHLLGIINEITRLKKENLLTNKKVSLLNIVWSFGESTSDFTKEFIDKAVKLVKSIHDDVDFEYKIVSIQDLLKKIGDYEAYEGNGKSVNEMIRDNFNLTMEL